MREIVKCQNGDPGAVPGASTSPTQHTHSEISDGAEHSSVLSATDLPKGAEPEPVTFRLRDGTDVPVPCEWGGGCGSPAVRRVSHEGPSGKELLRAFCEEHARFREELNGQRPTGAERRRLAIEQMAAPAVPDSGSRVVVELPRGLPREEAAAFVRTLQRARLWLEWPKEAELEPDDGCLDAADPEEIGPEGCAAQLARPWPGDSPEVRALRRRMSAAALRWLTEHATRAVDHRFDSDFWRDEIAHLLAALGVK